MKTTALRFRTLALGLAMTGSIAASLEAIDVFTDPVGYYTLSLAGGSDNAMSVPMVRDAVFSGAVDNGVNPFTANSFDVLAGPLSPGWTANQWAFAVGAQPQTYYVEFTTGALKGLYYKVTANGTGSLTVDTEGDSLLNHPLPGNLTAALADGDSFKIRPYWRIKDVFESNGTPIIESRTSALIAKDDILIPNYSTIGTNKPAELTLYHLAGQGWRAVAVAGDFGDYVLRPYEGFVVRRRNAVDANLTSLGGVLVNKAITFVAGGNGTVGNDTYLSLARPAAVSLDQSGLRIADQDRSLIKDSTSALIRSDELLAFDVPTTGSGINRPATHTYYYLAGQGWREVANPSLTVGQDVMLQPGRIYVLRKKSANPGRDWVNESNY